MPETESPFDPIALLGSLAQHRVEFVLIGGLGAAVHGSPYATVDVDVVPRHVRANLERLSEALRELQARVYVSIAESVAFDANARSLGDAKVWNLATCYGGLDISFVPAGTSGYSDLSAHATRVDLGGFEVQVAALEDIIRSKEAANREKDRVVLPALRRLLEMRDRE